MNYNALILAVLALDFFLKYLWVYPYLNFGFRVYKKKYAYEKKLTKFPEIFPPENNYKQKIAFKLHDEEKGFLREKPAFFISGLFGRCIIHPWPMVKLPKMQPKTPCSWK